MEDCFGTVELCEDEGCPQAGTPHVCIESPYVIQQEYTTGRWLIISRDIKDDCPIIDDFATEDEAQADLARIERERGAMEVPLSRRGFGT